MKRMKRAFVTFLSLVVLLTTPISGVIVPEPLIAEAHSGRTDSQGGHRDNKNKSGLGSYHYHCGGHPAHLHRNGVCPYAGKAASSSSSGGSTSNTSSNKTTTTIKQQSYSEFEKLLLNKYSYIDNEYNLKVATYPKEVLLLTRDFVNMDGVNNEYLCKNFLTPNEQADLYPIIYSVQTDIAAKIISLRLYEIFNTQYEAQKAQAENQLQIQEQQNTENQDAFLYSLVTQTQSQLAALGFYTGVIDGVFDAETQQALINFQTAYGLVVDGTINQEIVTVLGINVE